MLEAYSYKPAPGELTIKSVLFEDLYYMFPQCSAAKMMVIINQVLDEYGLDNIGSMTLWNVYARKKLITQCRNILKEL